MASLFNNAGAAGKGLCERLHSLTYVDLKGQMQEIVSGEFDFSYRRGPLKEGVIVGAKLKATQRNKKDIRNKIREHIQYRKKTQPLKSQSLGCVFKNPKSGFASQWIVQILPKAVFLNLNQSHELSPPLLSPPESRPNNPLLCPVHDSEKSWHVSLKLQYLPRNVLLNQTYQSID
jgi:hypothetical protein